MSSPAPSPDPYLHPAPSACEDARHGLGEGSGTEDGAHERVSTVTDTEVAMAPSTEPAPLPFWSWRRPWPSLVVIAVYLLIGIAAYWSMLPNISDQPFGIDPDFTQAMWFMAWVPHAIGHGLNPLFSPAIYVPNGVNLMESLASPLLGLLTAPLALVASPVMRANLLLASAMPVSATAGFIVLRRWRVWGPAAALGGLMYGFSPYMVGQSQEYIALTFLALPPFITLTVASILQNRGSPRRLGVQLGLLVSAQFLISSEVLATVVVLAVVAVVYVAIHDRAEVLERARTAARPVGIALVLAAVLLAYPLWMMLAGPQHFTGPAWAIANPYHNDLLSFVVPGPLQSVSLGMPALGARLDAVIGPTAGGYVGIPLLALAGIFAWRSRRNLRTQLAAILMLCALVLSLGPYLAVNGRLTHIPLPFLVLDHIPLFDSILPFRISFATDACLAAVLAFGLDDMRGGPGRSPEDGANRWRWVGPPRVAVLGLILIALVATQLPQWPLRPMAAPAVALPPAVRAAIPARDPVALSYPYATLYDMQPMAWQADDGFRFRLLGGYGFHPDAHGGPSLAPDLMSPPALQTFLAAQDGANPYGPPPPIGPELVASTRRALSRYDVRVVIVDRSERGSAPVVTLFQDALGPPKLSVGRFSLWAGWPGEKGTGPSPGR